MSESKATRSSARIPRVLHENALIGKQFGHVVVLGWGPPVGKTHPMWRCKCTLCGTEFLRKVPHRKTPRCQCQHRKHGHAKSRRKPPSPEYTSWAGMIQRCHNPKSPDFERYGGRGIVVCERWRTSFQSFLADMGPRPSKRHTIERRDGSKGYTPDNCRWATWTEQARNRRGNRLITVGGATRTLAEWAERSGISIFCLWRRLKKGWTAERAVCEKVHARGRRI